jgi:two-component system, OmpR family, alkaline phosphatase synthesis response regulator PhoP
METVLVIEDNCPLQRTLQRLFEADALQVRVASDGIAGVESFRQQTPTAVVLDLNLPGLPGKELCRLFKEQTPSVPVVILTANVDVEEKVALFEAGADDYITKPFSPRELLARVRRVIRRSAQIAKGPSGPAGNPSPRERLSFGNVEIDFTGMEASRGGIPVPMTAQEFKLIKFLAASPGRVITREELLCEVWGYQNYPSTRTVDNHVLRIRQKLEPDASNPRYIITVHGVGYKFVPGDVQGNPKV